MEKTAATRMIIKSITGALITVEDSSQRGFPEASISPITFIDKLVKKNELGQPFKLMDHPREILRLAFTFDDQSRLPWDTVIYSCVKKSGKTTLNGALTL